MAVQVPQYGGPVYAGGQYMTGPVPMGPMVVNGGPPSIIANGYPNQRVVAAGPTLIAAQDHYGVLPGQQPQAQPPAPRAMVHRSKGVQHIPLAKCRVLYLGSAVPLETAVGMEAVQMPLRERYPCTDADTEVPGIDAWLTVFSSGMLIQYVADKSSVTWFPISSLHVCAAVKCCVQVNGATGERTPKFVPLDSDVARSSQHPPMFASIMRRTKGVKVLECHVFIAKSDQAAMALVHSATHAYEHKELWVDEQPPPEMYAHSAPAQIVPAEPSRPAVQTRTFYNEETNGYQPPAEAHCNSKPPLQGYFYTPGKNLVKHYNVSGGKQQQPQPMMPPQPPPGQMVPMGVPPPPEYFSDWDIYGGSPVALFPGPYISPEDYEKQRTIRHTRHKRRRSPKRRSPTRRDQRGRRERSPESCNSYDEYVYERRPARSHTPPVDYGHHHHHHDDYYGGGHQDDYYCGGGGGGYYDDYYGGGGHDDYVVYASRYRDAERGRTTHREPSPARYAHHHDPSPRRDYDREMDDPYERNYPRENGHHHGYPDPHENGHHHYPDPYDPYQDDPYRDDYDYNMSKRGAKPYDNLERDLGYYP